MLKPFTSDEVSFLEKPARDIAIDNISGMYWHRIRAKGNYIIVKPYVRKDDGIAIPDSIRAEDGHHSVAAQVIDIGPVCYTDMEISGGVAWCEVGDWVFVPRVAGSRVAFKNSDGSDNMLRIVRENDIIAVINDPSEWEIRINSTKY